MDKQFFIDFLDAYNECWYEKDLERLKTFYVDELIYFDNHKGITGNDTYTLDEYIVLLKDFFTNGKTTESGGVEPLIIENFEVFSKEDSACLCYLAMYKSCPTPKVRCSIYLEKRENEWKICHIHCSFEP